MENSSHTHEPTTWASPQSSGISVFNRSSNANVAVIFVSFSVTMKIPFVVELDVIVKNPLPEISAANEYRITKLIRAKGTGGENSIPVHWIKTFHEKFCVGNFDAIAFPPESFPWHKISHDVERLTTNRPTVTL
jgi:hypothetical protein